MIYKDDWEKCKERFDAFWAGEYIERCCMAVTAPRSTSIGRKVEVREPKDLREQWTSSEYRYNLFLNSLSHTFFGGDAFPGFWVNLGPGVLASFVGAPYTLDTGTIWFDREPIIKDWDKMPDIRFHPESEMWKIVYEMTEFFCLHSHGEYCVSMTDLGGTLDIIASLRGSEKLLYDLYDFPEEVKALSLQIDDVWTACYRKLGELLEQYMEGVYGWLPVLYRKHSYPIQCDFSVMISTPQFEEFAVPSLIRQSASLDRCIYHLDGPGQLRHLDAILDIEGIHAIEWVPLPEKGRMTTGDEKWFPLYRKIQGKGKSLILRDVKPGCIENLLGNISSKGLFITTHCASEGEAGELLAKAEKWSHS